MECDGLLGKGGALTLVLNSFAPTDVLPARACPHLVLSAYCTRAQCFFFFFFLTYTVLYIPSEAAHADRCSDFKAKAANGISSFYFISFLSS